MTATCKLGDEDVPTFSLAPEKATSLKKTQSHFESPFLGQLTVTERNASCILILLDVFKLHRGHISI